MRVGDGYPILLVIGCIVTRQVIGIGPDQFQSILQVVTRVVTREVVVARTRKENPVASVISCCIPGQVTVA